MVSIISVCLFVYSLTTCLVMRYREPFNRFSKQLDSSDDLISSINTPSNPTALTIWLVRGFTVQSQSSGKRKPKTSNPEIRTLFKRRYVLCNCIPVMRIGHVFETGKSVRDKFIFVRYMDHLWFTSERETK